MQHSISVGSTKPHECSPSQAFRERIKDLSFPCIAARAAVQADRVMTFEATHIACPFDDQAILQFLHKFIDQYRNDADGFSSAVVIFREPIETSEALFEEHFWKRLQSLRDLDKLNYQYDPRVDSDPLSPGFSFSIKQEAFFIIGLHPGSSRPARKFAYPAIVFNPHQQFERLRKIDKYDKIKSVVRKRDQALAGTINPMLDDYGTRSEVFQYSGKEYDDNWICPLKTKHE